MAIKQSGLLVSLGKRLLGFSTSSSGCCAASGTTDDAKSVQPEPAGAKPLTPVADTSAASCCAPACCSAESAATPATAQRS
jgi:hypothetical protein